MHTIASLRRRDLDECGLVEICADAVIAGQLDRSVGECHVQRVRVAARVDRYGLDAE